MKLLREISGPSLLKVRHWLITDNPDQWKRINKWRSRNNFSLNWIHVNGKSEGNLFVRSNISAPLMTFYWKAMLFVYSPYWCYHAASLEQRWNWKILLFGSKFLDTKCTPFRKQAAFQYLFANTVCLKILNNFMKRFFACFTALPL